MTNPAKAQRSVSLVTGASGGIGSAVVAALRTAGEDVVGVDRVPGPREGDLVCDVSDPFAVEAMVATIEAERGPIDQLVNGAGLLCNLPALETSPQMWQQVFTVNTTSVHAVSTSVARRMVPRGRGAIVTVAS